MNRNCPNESIIDRSSSGIALPLVLSVLALLAIVVAAVSSMSLGSLNVIKVRGNSARSLYAAEAGVASAIRLLILDSGYQGSQQEPDYSESTRWQFRIFNNLDGSTPTASNGAVIPDGMAYILATGARKDGSYERRVGVLVRPISLTTSWPFAVGAGGEVRLQGGQKFIRGGIKANGPIRFGSPTTIQPRAGHGRVLTSTSLQVSGPTRMDSSQDARSRGSISGNIQNALEVVANDNTVDTEPFINDYRTAPTLSPSEQGQLVLPNPDFAHLTDPAVNPEVTRHTAYPDPFVLAEGIHYFPTGVTFNGSETIADGATIVAGGYGIVLDRAIGSAANPFRANLVALSDPAAPGALPSIDFKNNSHLQGLVYAHGDIKAGSNMTIEGVIIAYEGSIEFGANVDFILDGSSLNAPGFEAFQGVIVSGGGPGPGDSGPLEVVLWQRL